jgi:2-keto-4-pentenoate hydratase/2-oxohepta-3-ene-1,7-dioic acid hydratase in catechol pathway
VPQKNRYYRIELDEAVHWARAAQPTSDEPYPADEVLQLLSADPLDGGGPLDRTVDRSQVTILVPCTPTKIIGVARNFAAHAAERERAVPGEPLVFVKPLTTLVPWDGAIVHPPACAKLNYEGEMAVVIGKGGHAIPMETAMEHVWGYTVVDDVTARDIQNREENFVRAKGYDTFCPLGPCIATGLDPAGLVVETHVNGELQQHGAIADLVHPIPELIHFISSIMTLYPHDVICTGTPKGMIPINPGDVVEVSVAGIGKIRNPVVAAS